MQKTTPEQNEEGMKSWFAWKAQYDVQVTDIGAPLVNGAHLLPDGTIEPSAKQVSGYMMIEAQSMDAAVDIVKESPLFPYENGCGVEIYEAQSM